MRFAICDDDDMFCSMVDAMITSHGHEVIGIAGTTAAALGLVRQGHPEVVVIDPVIGVNADFDVIHEALGAGAKVIAFGRTSSLLSTGRYHPEPHFVPKPDLPALERIIERLHLDHEAVSETDRRHRPLRAASGPLPTGPGDAAAFYTALNEATDGDSVVSIAPGPSGDTIDPNALADLLADGIRGTDRLLVGGSSLIVLLPGGGTEAIESLFTRLSSDAHLSAGVEFRSVVVGADESPTDAFDRLKRADASIRP